MIGRPLETEYAPFYAGYLDLVPESDLIGALEAQPRDLWDYAATVAPEREQHRYASGKWSIREVVGHLCDGERVFGYRAFRFGRGDATPLPGFDENSYVEQSSFHHCSLGDLVREFSLLRESNLAALRALDESGWYRIGSANGSPMSVRALAHIMVGHPRHHLQVLRDRYAG
ncbi:MAG: DinB family protein [Candidatus Eisenbacteria bacterium]|uniref:DinB family protein n=1 Tax=Eiseniibacteriota bacterium TaxID=2212470 RepID=A0A956RPQ6_UNCEI|nr:DinB family protein [Candidatus Eisenbacteria bacterium]